MLRGFTAQASLDAPRFCISAGSPDTEVKGSASKAGDINGEVYFEEGIPEETVEELRGVYFVRGIVRCTNFPCNSDGSRCVCCERLPERYDGPGTDYSKDSRRLW